MNLDELKELVRGGETERVELKRSTGQRTAAGKTVCAMLNGLGGFVIFGVTDRGEIAGQTVAARTLEDVANELRKIEPPAFPEIETIQIQGEKAAVVLTVTGGGGPYTFDGRPYVRRGSTTVLMPTEEYNHRLMERLHATQRWENQPAPDGVTVDDLDAEQIQMTLENAIRLGRVDPATRRDIESILRGLELIHDGRLLNAAVALFGSSNRLKPLYPQLEIRLARFRGRDRLADFADNRQYWGHAFSLLRRAESFLMDHVPIAGRVIPGKMVREDQPLYPPRATREAIANAICHRDYAIPGGAVAVAMYDDHLEITNPGRFHFGITPEKLARPHESKPWNPIIANVFYRAGIIERWGSGTLNIIDWCNENGNPPPTWQEQAGSVYVTFRPAVLPDETQVAGELGPKSVPSLSQVCPKSVPSDLLIPLLQIATTPAPIEFLMKVAGQTNRTRFRNAILRPLLDAGLIEMTIPDKPRSSKQKYRLTERGRRVLKEHEGGTADEHG